MGKFGHNGKFFGCPTSLDSENLQPIYLIILVDLTPPDIYFNDQSSIIIGYSGNPNASNLSFNLTQATITQFFHLLRLSIFLRLKKEICAVILAPN